MASCFISDCCSVSHYRSEKALGLTIDIKLSIFLTPSQ